MTDAADSLIGAVFRLWHAHKHSSLSRKRLVAMAQPLLLEMRTFLDQNLNAPSLAISRLCGQLLKKWDSLFTFIYHEGGELLRKIVAVHPLKGGGNMVAINVPRLWWKG